MTDPNRAAPEDLERVDEDEGWRKYRALLGPVLVVALFAIGTVWSPFEPHRPPSEDAPTPPTAPLTGSARPTGPTEGHDLDEPWDDETRWDFNGAVARALEAGADTLPFGDALVAVGRTFLGTPYVPGTLDPEGPERLVVNFRGLDCVTYVETVWALTRYVKLSSRTLASHEPERAERFYRALLNEIRYRDGIRSYPTRLHYFSDWIQHGEDRNLLDDLGEELGGVLDDEPIDFMSSHTDAYRQLADPAFLDAIRERERTLSERGRHYIPEDAIASAAPRIRNGDVIAATSTVPGLDIAHVGFAVWIDDALHLMHAPLVGTEVQLSDVSLAERIARIDGQDGIMVARLTLGDL